jgi:hypothetical protein
VGTWKEGSRAFVWERGIGAQSVRDLLIANGVTIPTGWTLNVANGISDDGTIIVGEALVGGQTTAWLAVIPEPAVIGPMMTVAALALSRRPRRSYG